jgi:hypothetical protein
MRTSVIILDDFYSNPQQVRDFALQQPFDITGNWPGHRTRSFLTEDAKAAIQRVIEPSAGQVVEWHQRDGFTGSFEIDTCANRTWIHTDHHNMWAGVCYLTPNAPHTGGTGLFRHRASGDYRRGAVDHPGNDRTEWDLFDVIGNRFNRLVMYRSDLFHCSLDYFGRDLHSGRLFQLFFFDTER